MFVLGPKDEEVVVAPPELLDSEHPPHYVPFTFEHYRSLRNANRFLLGEALTNYQCLKTHRTINILHGLSTIVLKIVNHLLLHMHPNHNKGFLYASLCSAI